MNKSELIDRVAKTTGITKKDTERTINGFMDVVKDVLGKSDDKIQLVGFGTFKVVDRKERKGMNIQTRRPITIPAKKAVRFVPGKTLKELVNR